MIQAVITDKEGVELQRGEFVVNNRAGLSKGAMVFIISHLQSCELENDYRRSRKLH